MNSSKLLSEHASIEGVDTLTMYHHANCFDNNLRNLFSILNAPKEFNLVKRFKAIEGILTSDFRLELLHHLSLIQSGETQFDASIEHLSRPQFLLHLWCLLGCTDSTQYIAGYLGLEISEVEELNRELHNHFSIQSLASRIMQLYETNKQIRELPRLNRIKELLGVQTATEPKDTAEERKNRFRRRYGYLFTALERNSRIL